MALAFGVDPRWHLCGQWDPELISNKNGHHPPIPPTDGWTDWKSDVSWREMLHEGGEHRDGKR